MYKRLVDTIINAQVAIIGPIATEISSKVDGINNPSKEILEALVKQYEMLFGQASVETCKDAIKDIVMENNDIDLPEILK